MRQEKRRYEIRWELNVRASLSHQPIARHWLNVRAMLGTPSCCAPDLKVANRQLRSGGGGAARTMPAHAAMAMSRLARSMGWESAVATRTQAQRYSRLK